MQHVPSALVLVVVSLFCAPTSGFAAEGRRLAFLVAVTEYSHAGLDPLEFTERDINDMANRLGEVGFDVVTLTPQQGKRDQLWKPTAENIRKRLPEFLQNRKVGRDDLVLLGLSGHGLQPRGSGDSFFCPADANPTMSDIDQGKKQVPKFPQTLVSVGELLTLVEESGVGHKLVLVDACRNEPKTKGVKTIGIDRVNLGELPGQTAVLLSCSKGEFSFENKQFGGGHGAFFHSVIEGLSGKARDNDQQVTFDSLAAYVRKNVPAEVDKVYGADGGRQRPNQISNVEGEPLVLIPAAMLAKVSPVKPEPAQKRESPTIPLGGKAASTDLLGKKAGQERDDNGLRLALVWCPAGKFTMGSPKKEKGRSEFEDQTSVELSDGFWTGKYEVTQKQYEQVMGSNPSAFTAGGRQNARVASEATEQFPVDSVSYDDAFGFCRKLTDQERQNGQLPANWEFSLPTEAQWEYACRAGSKTPFAYGGSLNGRDANCDGLSPYGPNAKKAPYASPTDDPAVGGPGHRATKGAYLNRTAKVGSYSPNAWGLYDMHGNVFEWCRDWFEKKLPGGRDPEVSAGAKNRVIRGGTYNSEAVGCRSAARNGYAPETRFDLNGFRVVLVRVR